MDPVAAYLEYLREMARKIAFRGTFLNVLHRKPRRTPDRYLSLDAPRSETDWQRYLTAVDQDARAQDGRTLFVGIGLLAGRLVFDGGTKMVAAPLLTVPVELERPELPATTFRYEPQWSAVSPNYDLLTAILEKADTTDPEDAIGQADLISPAATKAITDLELELAKRTKSLGAEQRLCDRDFLEASMEKLRSEVPAFRERLSTAHIPFRKEDLKSVVDRDGLRWFNHRFAFMGSMPDSLSAYEALDDLCSRLRPA